MTRLMKGFLFRVETVKYNEVEIVQHVIMMEMQHRILRHTEPILRQRNITSYFI